MKMKLMMTAVALLSLFGLSSCFEVESTISLKKDGSGTVTEEVYFSAQALAQMKQFGGEGEGPLEGMLNTEKNAAKAKEMGTGVTFVSAKKIEKEGKQGVLTTYAFTDINTLRYSGAELGDKQQEKKEKPQNFFYKEGVLTIKQSAEDMNLNNMKNIDPAQVAMMNTMLKGSRMIIKLQIENGIAKTNASHTKDNAITLVDIQPEKMLADVELLKKAANTQPEEKGLELLNGIEGVTIEFQKEVSVTLK